MRGGVLKMARRILQSEGKLWTERDRGRKKGRRSEKLEYPAGREIHHKDVGGYAFRDRTDS